MTIYLRHFIHGTKVAISEAEAIADEKNGWVRYEVGEPDVPVMPVARQGRPPKANILIDSLTPAA